MKPKKREVLYVYVTPAIKKWLKDMCKKEEGFVSQSTMAARIFEMHRKTLQARV